MPDGQEVRVTSETGGSKGSKPVQLFTLPPAGLEEVGKVAAMGAEKYEAHNYRRGYPWSLSANAIYRHLLRWQSGESCDSESGLHHGAHLAWHGLVLVQFELEHPDFDDRFKR